VAHLDEDSVLAFVDGTLAADARTAAESHLAGCTPCADLVAAAAGANPSRLGGSTTAHLPLVGTGLARGAAVGRYLILDVVGRGGMGEVYAAYDPQLDRKVALKLLHEQGSSRSEQASRARMLREAKTIARLSHRNVVVVHDAGEIDGRVFIAMEFIEGQTLGAWLAAAPRGWREIRDVFLAAGEGLAAAHEAGFVHRDFKPQNVMVGNDGTVRVMDFGLASGGAAIDDDDGAVAAVAPTLGVTPDTVALTRTGVLLGTPLYMAPEQFLARRTDARSDQFSFSVALHESLYGERPFPSESFTVLSEAVKAGRVREPAQRGRTPAFIRKLLLRGLRPDPDERYPSMRALLEALRHDPVRTRRRIGIAAAIVMIAAVGVTATARLATRGARSCRAAGAKLAGIWPLASADGGADRREAIHRALVATGVSYAPETWTRVAGLLDGYVRSWSDAYTDACEATHVRGDQSSDVLDLRMTCLEQPRGALRALTDVLARADNAVVVQAVNAAQALPPIDRCADVASLKAVVPPPSDAASRARVEALRAELTEVKALSDTGQWPLAQQKAAPIVGAARTVGYAPLLAEALEARAWLEERRGDAASAARSTEEALWEALAGRRDDVALECAALLSGYAGYDLGRYDDAERWDSMGQSLLQRLGFGHERAAAWLMQNRALTRLRKGDLQRALTDLNGALALKQKALGPYHPDVAGSWDAIGVVRELLGDNAGALAAHDSSLDVHRRAYGAESPLLAKPLGNRGGALALLGRHDEAQRDLRESIARWTSSVGPDHPWVAYPLTALGKSLLAVGRTPDAIELLERAVRIREQSEPDTDMVAEARFALALALSSASKGRDPDRARALAVNARDAYRKLPGQAKHAAEIDAWLASAGGPTGSIARR